MLKRTLIFIGYLSLVLVAFVQSHELPLAFFVFFPMTILPILFFMEEPYRNLLVPALSVLVVGYIYQSFNKPLLGMIFFGLGSLLFLSLVMAHHFFSQRRVRREVQQCNLALGDLETLKQKHQSRLESLHHLEKQVAGLLDLFEIARDFNDCLSFDAMADILHHRVLPELPFIQFAMILYDEKPPVDATRVFLINDQRGGIDGATLASLTDEENQLLVKARAAKKMLQSTNHLVFPLNDDGEVTAIIMVTGSQPDDLAKFEVLAAYMTLQVKKVRLYEAVKELSIQDGLTGVFVRRHFLERFDEELKRSIKYNLPLALLMLDIDHFKRYNDQYGHLAGDATLKQVAFLLRENLRKVDIVARYGGEEFVVVTPETRHGEALEVAERIRSGIARHNFRIYSDQARVTVSIGVAIFPSDFPDFITKDPAELAADMIVKADRALYRAKEEGRNRVIQYQDL